MDRLMNFRCLSKRRIVPLLHVREPLPLTLVPATNRCPCIQEALGAMLVCYERLVGFIATIKKFRVEG